MNHMDEDTNNKIRDFRGGRRGTGEPSEIRESIAEARKEAVRIDHDLAKLKNDKGALLFTIADLRVKEKQAVRMGLSSDTDAIRKELKKAQDKIDKINGVLDETNSSEDHKKIQKIVSDWYGGKRDLGKEQALFQKAEKTLEGNPGDRRAQGDANRARAEMQSVKEHLGDIAKQAEIALKSAVRSAAEDESISFTHEQELLEREALEDRHKKSQKIVPEAVQTEKEPAKEELATEIVEPTQPTDKQKEEQIIFGTAEEKTPEVKFLPDPETDDDLLPVVIPGTLRDATGTTRKYLHVFHEFFQKIFAFFAAITAKLEKQISRAPSLTAMNDDSAQEASEEAVPEINISTDEFLERPLFTEFEATDDQATADTVNVEVPVQEVPVAIEAEAPTAEVSPTPLLQQEISQEETIDTSTGEHVATMPQEITPGDRTEFTQIKAQADEVLRGDIDEIFGVENGPFGIFGHTSGFDSKNWKDPEAGFGVKTVGDILKATPPASLAEGEALFGIENLDNVAKMKKYLANVSRVSGLSLEANEGAELADFIRRGALAKLSK